METWEGKNFSITDPKGVSTVIYQVTETEKEFREEGPRYTVERAVRQTMTGAQMRRVKKTIVHRQMVSRKAKTYRQDKLVATRS